MKKSKNENQRLLRQKPGKETNVGGPAFNIRLDKLVNDYNDSNVKSESFIKPPNSDSVGDSVEQIYIEALEENKKMVKMQQRFMKRREEIEDKLNEERTKSIYEIQAKLRQKFIRTTDFIKDCEDKERIAIRTCKEQTDISEKVKKDIDKARESLDTLSDFRDVLKNTSAEYVHYVKVLDEAVQKSLKFDSVKGCIDHCDALMIAQTEIAALQTTKLKEIEQMRQGMVKISGDAAMTVLGMQNELTLLQRDYHKASSNWKAWGERLAKAKRAKMQNEAEKVSPIRELETIHKMLCRHRGEDVKIKSTENMIDFILNEYEILKQTLEKLEKTEKKSKHGC